MQYLLPGRIAEYQPKKVLWKNFKEQRRGKNRISSTCNVSPTDMATWDKMGPERPRLSLLNCVCTDLLQLAVQSVQCRYTLLYSSQWKTAFKLPWMAIIIESKRLKLTQNRPGVQVHKISTYGTWPHLWRYKISGCQQQTFAALGTNHGDSLCVSCWSNFPKAPAMFVLQNASICSINNCVVDWKNYGLFYCC